MITYMFMSYFFVFEIIILSFIMLMNKQWKNIKSISFLGCIISVFTITMICFFPFPYQAEILDDIHANHETGCLYNFIPFKSIIGIIREAFTYKMYGQIVTQIIGNILLFTPFTMFLSGYYDDKNRFIKVVISSLFLTILVESLQGIFNSMLQYNYRAVDIDDIILNTLGGILGYLVFRIVSKLYKKFLKM